MKPNELRIGNYIDLGGGRNLWQISEDDILATLNLNPILLSEEWLKKFGFEKGGNYFSKQINSWDSTIYIILEDLDYVIYFEEENMDERHANNYVSLCAIKYVHELQNLWFALTKNELNITPYSSNR